MVTIVVTIHFSSQFMFFFIVTLTIVTAKVCMYGNHTFFQSSGGDTGHLRGGWRQVWAWKGAGWRKVAGNAAKKNREQWLISLKSGDQSCELDS